MLHCERNLAEHALKDALKRGVRDPELGRLQQNLMKQYRFFHPLRFLGCLLFLQVTRETSSSSFSLLSIVFNRWQIHGKQLPHKGRWKPPVGLQPVQGCSPSCRACPRCRTPVPLPAPLSSRRQRWEDREEDLPKYINNYRKGVHFRKCLAEKALKKGLDQNAQDPELMHLQRQLHTRNGAHSRPHGSNYQAAQPGLLQRDRFRCQRRQTSGRFSLVR